MPSGDRIVSLPNSDLDGDWPALARAACVELYGGRQVEDESTGIRLLSDIRDVFGEDDRVMTTILLDRLNALDESPWCDWFGKPLTHRGLAKLLDRYRIKSRNVRLPDGKTPKGFLRAQFEGAWARYLAPNPPQRHNRIPLRKTANLNPPQAAPCGGQKTPAIPLQERDVAVWRIDPSCEDVAEVAAKCAVLVVHLATELPGRLVDEVVGPLPLFE